MSVPPPPAPRARPAARKKLNDDAAYFGSMPSGSAGAAKRHRESMGGEGEPRVKRKRVNHAAEAAALAVAASRGDMDGASLVEFIKMPTPVIYRYLTHFDLIPHVKPSPLTEDDPPPPSVLDKPAASHGGQTSRPPTPTAQSTPANRPRRESQGARRRSSRFSEDITRPPILADVDELHYVLAGIAERHFREQLAGTSGRDEVDTLASFMCAVEKAKGGKHKF